MSIRIDLPSALENKLRQDLDDVTVAGKEAMLVELYRQGQLTRVELSQGLGLSRLETDGVLKRHNVTEDLLSPADLDEQAKAARNPHHRPRLSSPIRHL